MAKHIKSERLKKLEVELNDLEQWLKLSLVPKKDIEKHKEEIAAVKDKIQEERDRLQFLKESGDVEEYIAPKRTPTRAGYTEMPTIPDIDAGDTAIAGQETSAFNADNETTEGESSIIEEQEDTGAEYTFTSENDEESYFSDRNRWKRGGIIDPDADEW